MANHRKNSSKKRMRAGEFAVAAFLGLAVTAVPAVAAADTTDGTTTGPSSDSGSKTTDTTPTSTGPGSATGDGPSSAPDGADDDDAADDEDEDAEDGLAGGDGADDDEDQDDDTEDDADDDADDDAEAAEGGAGDGTTEPTGGQTPETGGSEGAAGETTEPGVVEPPVVEPPVVEPPVVEPPAAENPATPTETDTDPIIAPSDIPDTHNAAQPAALSGSDPTPTPPALASALIEIDLVPKPPSIPAFAPFMGVVNALANWVNQIFPPYDSDPILNPTQVAAGWVMTLFAGLQGTYWNGQPTPFTFGALVLMTAAYQRYERLATNHLPGAPTVSAGPLPLTWKLKSVDPDGDPLIYSVDLNGQPSNGLITMSPDGTFSFVPTSLDDLNNGTDVTFTVRVNDSLGFLENPLTPDGNDAFYTVTFRYPGLGINNLPVFQSGGQAQVTGYDPITGKVIITAQATDSDGDELTYTATSLWGNVVRNEDGTFTYTPTDFARHAAATLLGAKTDLITIWANDGRGGITVLPTAVTVDIISANKPPTITVGAANTEPITGIITGSFDVEDEDGDLVIVTGDLVTSRGGIVAVTPLGYMYTPTLLARSQGGTDSFTVTLNDAHGGVVEVVVTVTINRINSNPIGGITSALPDSDGVVRGTVAATDLDGDDLTFTLAGGASSGYSSGGGIVLLNSDGTFTFIPKPGGLLGDLTLDSFEVNISDGRGGTATTTVTLFANLKIDPVVTSNAGGVINGGLDIDDNDNTGVLTYGVGNGPSRGTVTVNADGTYTYTATTAGWNESDTFTIVGTVDGKSITVAEVTVVPRPNVAPTAPLIDGAVIVGGSGIATGNVGAADDDNDTLHYSVTGYGGGSSKVLGNGSIVTVDANGKWSYVPGRNSGVLGAIVGSTFTVYVTDGKGGQTSTLVTVTTHDLDLTVTKNNGGHGITTGGVQLAPNEQGVLIYSVGTGPTKGTVTVNPDGTYTYNRTAVGHTGGATDTFEIIGTVGGVSIVVATVTVTPTLSNAAPTAGTTTITESSLGISILGLRTQSSKGKVTAFDADGDAISYPGGSILPAMYGTANGGSVSFYSDGTFTYSITKTNSYFHAAAANGATGPAVNDTFTITVTDSLGASATIVVSVPVEKLNAGPSSSVSTNATSDALGVVRGTLNGSDDDDDTLTYSLIGVTGGSAYTANGGIVTLAGNSFTYIPTKSGATTDTFQVTVSDGHGGTTTATISVAQATPSPVTLSSPGANTQKVTLNVPAADAALLTFSVGAQGTKGTVVRNADGTYTYTRTASLGHTTTPNDSFTIVGTDASGKTVTIATVDVAPPVSNIAPIGGAVAITSSSLEDNTVLGVGTWKQRTSGTLSATDADGDSVSWTAGTYSSANGGSVVVNANGAFSYTIDKAYSYFHGAARVGAGGTAFADNFSVTVVDGFGGSTTYSVSVNIYAHNEPPSISGGTRVILSNNWIGVFGSGSNGDSVNTSITAQTGGGSASYDSTWGTLNTTGKSGGNTVTLTATETEYYRVVNGVVQVGTLSSTSRTFTV